MRTKTKENKIRASSPKTIDISSDHISPGNTYISIVEPEVIDKRIFNGRAFLYDDPLVLKERIEDYFVVMKEENRPPTMSGLAVHLNISRSTLINYEKHYPSNKDLFHAIKFARARVESSLDEKIVSGMPATGLIFNLKNNFGWKDQMQLDVTSNGQSLFDRESILLASKELLMEEESLQLKDRIDDPSSTE